MIDTQQQYINLNIRGEISIIVVQAHYNNLVFIEKMGCIKMRKIRREGENRGTKRENI